MKIAVLAALFSMPLPLAAAPDQSRAQQPAPSAAADRVGEAYLHFMLGHRLEEADDTNGAIAEYKRAIELDPTAADIPGELAGLYLRENKIQEAMAAAEQALKIAPANREANRVLGTIYAALSESASTRGRSGSADENVAKAIRYLEAATERSAGQPDPNIRATLARLYVRSGAYDKAIPVLTDLVNQEPGWQDGPLMLAEAYAGAGRTKDAIAWLEERTADDPRLLPALADFYERERRWPDAVGAYARAVQRMPRNTELKSRYASALLNLGGRDNAAKARDVLTEVVAARSGTPDARALYMLSQAQRRLGDYPAAEATARRVIAQNSKSPWGSRSAASIRRLSTSSHRWSPSSAARAPTRRSTSASCCRISASPTRSSASTTRRSTRSRRRASWRPTIRRSPDTWSMPTSPPRSTAPRRRWRKRRWRSIRTTCA
jgi:tetratricopeptide (TPR) repeat protein